MSLSIRSGSRFIATLLALSFLAPILGCGRSSQQASNPPGNAPYGSVPPPTQQPQQGMSTRKKVLLLAGAAALFYLYNKKKNSQGVGKTGQYYRSKNGRVYYRDAKGNAIWVTPPAGGIEVPAEEGERYQRAAQRYRGAPDTVPEDLSAYGL